MSVAEELIQTALLGEAVDVGPALVFVADEEMRYIAVNRRACDVLGYSREEESGAEYDQMLARGFRHGSAVLTRKDGGSVSLVYQARETVAAGLKLFISVGFVAD